jgi:hypothetical protein
VGLCKPDKETSYSRLIQTSVLHPPPKLRAPATYTNIRSTKDLAAIQQGMGWSRISPA